MRNTHRGGDQRQRDPEGRPTQTSDLEKNTQAGISTDPQTSPGHTPSPSQPQFHSALPEGGHWHSAGQTRGTPDAGRAGDSRTGRNSGPGKRQARSAHKETARPAGAGSARPHRDSRPPPTRALAPHTHMEPQHPIRTPRDPAPPRPTQSQPPGRAVLTSCRQQKATSVQRPLHLPMAPGAAQAVRRGAPLARRPPPSRRRTSSASFP